MGSFSVIEELPLSITMFPVSPPPRVRVWLLVVDKDPTLSSTKSPDRVAVWVPLAPSTFVIANFALSVLVPPINKSTTLAYVGVNAPWFRSQYVDIPSHKFDSLDVIYFELFNI